MKVSKLIIAAGVALAAAGLPSSFRTGAIADDAPPPVVQPQSQDAYWQAIAGAANPSAAVDAYAKGIAAEPKNLDLEKAYVGRMVAFGLPEMADTQARDLTAASPNDGLPWAVTAYTNARHGDTSMALVQIAIAAKRAPADPFVLRTAGQLLAWYDTRADQSKISDPIKQTVQSLRQDLNGNAVYAQAYAEAKQYYAPPVPAPIATAPPVTVPNTVVAPNTVAAPAYTQSPPVNYVVPEQDNTAPPAEVYYTPNYVAPYTDQTYVDEGYYSPPTVIYESYPQPEWNVGFGWWPTYYVGGGTPHYHHDFGRSEGGHYAGPAFRSSAGAGHSFGGSPENRRGGRR